MGVTLTDALPVRYLGQVDVLEARQKPAPELCFSPQDTDTCHGFVAILLFLLAHVVNSATAWRATVACCYTFAIGAGRECLLFPCTLFATMVNRNNT